MPCSICPAAKVFARGLCQPCYYRLRRNGSLDRKNIPNVGLCSEPDCATNAFSKGLCQRHYDAQRHPMVVAWTLLRSRNRGEYPDTWDRFDVFLADVGERPSPKHQLRRIDTRKPFAVDNFHWHAPITVGDHYSPEGRRKYEREWRFQRKFGIKVADYEKMLTEQGGGCAICKRAPDRIWRRTDKIMDLAVDHDHSTGKVRGILCTDCNVVLGLVKDSRDRLQAMIGYLDRTANV